MVEEEQSAASKEDDSTTPKVEEESTTQEEESTTPKNIVTIEEAGPCKKKVSIEIPEEAIKSATDEQYNTLRKEALVPGFRKGRAPRRLLEKRFGKDTTEQIKLKLLADASESLKFDFEVEVRPDFDLPQLEGIPVTRTKLEVSDEQIDREIERLQSLTTR